jgi:hypothetical protein
MVVGANAVGVVGVRDFPGLTIAEQSAIGGYTSAEPLLTTV